MVLLCPLPRHTLPAVPAGCGIPVHATLLTATSSAGPLSLMYRSYIGLLRTTPLDNHHTFILQPPNRPTTPPTSSTPTAPPTQTAPTAPTARPTATQPSPKPPPRLLPKPSRLAALRARPLPAHWLRPSARGAAGRSATFWHVSDHLLH